MLDKDLFKHYTNTVIHPKKWKKSREKKKLKENIYISL